MHPVSDLIESVLCFLPLFLVFALVEPSVEQLLLLASVALSYFLRPHLVSNLIHLRVFGAVTVVVVKRNIPAAVDAEANQPVGILAQLFHVLAEVIDSLLGLIHGHEEGFASCTFKAIRIRHIVA